MAVPDTVITCFSTVFSTKIKAVLGIGATTNGDLVPAGEGEGTAKVTGQRKKRSPVPGWRSSGAEWFYFPIQ